MRLSVCLLLLNAIGAYAASFQEGLEKLDSVQEASLDLLNQYDALIKQYPTDPMLYKAYEKLGYTQLMLNRESQTIRSFEKALELNPINTPLKKNLFDLYFKFGVEYKMDRLVKRLKIPQNDALVVDYKQKFKEVDELVSKNELDSAINIAPYNPYLRSSRIVEIIRTMPKDDHSKQREIFNNLIDDYLNLIKSPTASLSLTNNLYSLAQIYIFNNLELKNANILLKKCLQYDNEDINFKKTSKFINKYSPILDILSKYNKIFQSWDEKDEDLDIEEVDQNEINQLFPMLIMKEKMIKIRKYNDEYANNMDYMNQLGAEFDKYYNVERNTMELTLLKIRALSAFNKKNWKSFDQEMKKITKFDTSQENNLLNLCYKIDQAFEKHDFNRVKELINSANKNMKKTSIFKPRLDKYNAHIQQEQRQRQQQQQQQHFHHQQQQRQQQAKAQGPPKNDYYKILGVSKTATQQEIKKAYREMTKQFHPDKYKGDESKEEIEHKMTQINHAYEVLSDEKTRKDYDDFGDDPNDTDRKSGAQQGSGNPFAGFNFQHGNNGGFGGFGNGGGFKFGGGGFKFAGSQKKQKGK